LTSFNTIYCDFFDHLIVAYYLGATLYITVWPHFQVSVKKSTEKNFQAIWPQNAGQCRL